MILAEVTIKNRVALLAQIIGCIESTNNRMYGEHKKQVEGDMMAINITNKKTQFNTVF